VQNIKSSHLGKFIKINLAIAVLSLSTYLLIFRYDSNSMYSLGSEINYVILVFSDFLTYLVSSTFILLLNIYLALRVMCIRIINFCGSIVGFSTIQSQSGALLSEIPNKHISNKISVAQRLPAFSTKSECTTPEQLNIANRLFSLKNNLDLLSTASACPAPAITDLANSDLFIFAAGDTISRNRVRSLNSLESHFISSEYSRSFNKTALSETSFKELASEPFIFSAVENSVSSSFNQANANRWLLKMLPFSENLAINNSYFTKAKESISNSLVESKLRNTNVWAGNLQLATLPNYLNNVNTSLVNNFEYSRL
jgi:hypothetical protein